MAPPLTPASMPPNAPLRERYIRSRPLRFSSRWRGWSRRMRERGHAGGAARTAIPISTWPRETGPKISPTISALMALHHRPRVAPPSPTLSPPPRASFRRRPESSSGPIGEPTPALPSPRCRLSGAVWCVLRATYCVRRARGRVRYSGACTHQACARACASRHLRRARRCRRCAPCARRRTELALRAARRAATRRCTRFAFGRTTP